MKGQRLGEKVIRQWEWGRATVKRDHIGLDVTVRTLGEIRSPWRVLS